jgi:glycosyltransferase involved in cell wall biosynthesis
LSGKLGAILYVTHDYSTFTKGQIEAIAPHFENVTVVVRCNAFAEVGRRLPFKGLRSRSSDALIDRSCIPKNVRVHIAKVPYTSSIASYKKLGGRHLRSVEEVVRREFIEFDLIHSHYVWSSGFVGAELARKAGVPSVITAHGYDVYDLPFRAPSLGESVRRVLASTDSVITVSERNRRTLVDELGASPSKVSVIPNGFDPTMFAPMEKKACRSKLGLDDVAKLVLAIGNTQYVKKDGRNVDVKGHAILCESARSIGDAQFAIVGDVSKSALPGTIPPNVRLVGKVAHREMPIWLNACDVFALPSLFEGVPASLFEAMACGKPCVVTDVGGMPDAVSNGRLGTVVAPGDPMALTNALQDALEKKWDAETIVDESRRYSWDEIAKAIIDIYRRLK